MADGETMILADGQDAESIRKALDLLSGSVRQLEKALQEVPRRSYLPPLLPVEIDRVTSTTHVETPP
jgi:hypothetical protein